MPRALLSVYDKTGIVDVAARLVDLGWEIVSSGGTAGALTEAGVAVVPVESVTGSPEMLDGRVKTLHPAIHGGILADRSKPTHRDDLDRNGITGIDLVVCNLYPFRSDPSVELIDIGGPTMVRAAAKNFAHVGIVVDPADYDVVVAEIAADGALSDTTRRRLARAAFAHTAAYDSAIVGWLDDDDPLPPTLHLSLERAQDLRYGENPHQDGARYRTIGASGWWDGAEQLGGKQMSYLNLYDTEAAWNLVHEIGDEPAVVIVKHANPCGVAVADTLLDAYERAHACDSTSAFGGIIAANREVDAAMAAAVAPVFTEVVVAPGFSPEAVEILSARKNLRILTAPSPQPEPHHVRTISGGLLVQGRDTINMNRADWRAVTERQPTDAEWADLELAWVVCARVSSNAIVLVKDGQAFGIGAGQQSRVDAAKVAARKADGRAAGGACASDAFFPFRDGLDAAIDAGATAVVQPGGSVRDDEVIAAADELGLAMVFTSERHFRH